MAEYEGYDEPMGEELFDGVQATWNCLPSTLIGQKKLVIPIATMYTPLMSSDEYEPERVNSNPCICSNPSCGAALNPFSQVDYVSKMWTCCMCGTRCPFPPHIARTLTPGEPPQELQEQNTTIEYCRTDLDPQFPPIILFVIDTCIEEDELGGLTSAIEQLFSTIPSHIAEDVYFGLITFGKHVSLYELGTGEGVQSIQSFRGDGAEASIENVIKQANLNPNDLSRFFAPLAEKEDVITNILLSLERDVWPRQAQQRNMRATGAAVQVAVGVLETLYQGQSARVCLFTGGPCTAGPGKVIDLSLEFHMRSHKDITDGKAELYEPAIEFYRSLAARAANNSHVVDIFACSLDQNGIAEERCLVENTGGCLILSDSFMTPTFSESFKEIFAVNKHDELSMCFNGEIQVITSPELACSGCIGPVTSMGTKSTSVSDQKPTGVGDTCKWSMGGVDSSLCLAFYFHIRNKSNVSLEGRNAYIQFFTTYRDANGYDVSRTTTLALAFKNEKSTVGFNQIRDSFDQEAAVAAIARAGVFRAENEYDHNILGWLDTTLIRTICKVADFQKDRPETFNLNQNFTAYPEYMYYFRRSRFVRVFGYSPDETTYYRSWLLRAGVDDLLTMIQPTLTCYSAEDEPYAVSLDVSSRKPDQILLLDTFFYVIKWTGGDVAQWRDDNLRDDPEYKHLGEFQDAAEEAMVERCSQRFPWPTEVRCDEGTSQARFLIATLNPDSKSRPRRRLYDGDLPPVFTDDVNLQTFFEHLKLKVVTCDL